MSSKISNKKGKKAQPVPKPRATKEKKVTKTGDMNGHGTGDESIQHFYSVGTRDTQPPFSDLKRNFFATIDLNGSPFFTGTQPTNGRSKYDYNRTAIDVSDYFVDNLFGAYEYYRVSKIETTFIWGKSSERGVINAELFTSIDKDSRDTENSNAYINRRNLKRKVFNLNQTTHTITYQPYMVDFVDDEETEAVRYIQPVDRWWNCEDFRNHRWGCLRYVIVNHEQSEIDAAVFVQHRVWLETKGQKDVITPSVPPAALQGIGKQNEGVDNFEDDSESICERGGFFDC